MHPQQNGAILFDLQDGIFQEEEQEEEIYNNTKWTPKTTQVWSPPDLQPANGTGLFWKKYVGKSGSKQ